MKKRILVFGCTGSIGTSTLNLFREFPEKFEAAGLTAHSSKDRLAELSKEFMDAPTLLFENTNKNDLINFIRECKPDLVVNGISGSAGLLPSIATLEEGIDLALANKETIVMAGRIVKSLANKNKCRILPVDSEHSAIFSLIERHKKDSIQEIILTASGGPFKDLPQEKLKDVTASQALKHPTWNMGKKITIDSASMANKGLEIIEACQLFDFPPDKVKVVVHPQSLVHSLARTKDGVLYAQLSHPDMRHPILTAISWPDFVPNGMKQLDLSTGCTLSFFPPRIDAFPMLRLAYDVAEKDGGYAIAYNAANEIAVPLFIEGEIAFTDIPKITQQVLCDDWSEEPVTIDDVFLFDKRARSKAQQIAKTLMEVSF